MSFADIVGNLISFLNGIVYLLIALAVFGFLYGLVGYISSSESESKREDSRNYIIAGLVGIFVMFAVWGLVFLVTNSFSIEAGLPQIN